MGRKETTVGRRSSLNTAFPDSKIVVKTVHFVGARIVLGLVYDKRKLESERQNSLIRDRVYKLKRLGQELGIIEKNLVWKNATERGHTPTPKPAENPPASGSMHR